MGSCFGERLDATGFDRTFRDDRISGMGRQTVGDSGVLRAEETRDVDDDDAELKAGDPCARIGGRVYIREKAGFAPGSKGRSSTTRESLTFWTLGPK